MQQQGFTTGRLADAVAATRDVNADAPDGSSSSSSGDRLNFRVVVTLPASSAQKGCSTWFDSKERITLFRQLVSGAYATALKIPKGEVQIGSVKCGSSTIFSKSSNNKPPRRPAPARLLLSSSHHTEFADAGADAISIQLLPEQAAAAGAFESIGLEGSSSRKRSLLQALASPVNFYTEPVPISTGFSVPAPDAGARARVVQTVASQSPAILSGALSSFFGTPLSMVNAEEPAKKTTSKALGEKPPANPAKPATAAAANKTQTAQKAPALPKGAALAPQPHKPEPALQDADEQQQPKPTPTQQAQLYFKQQQRQKQWRKRDPAQPLAAQYHLPAEQQLQPAPFSDRPRSAQLTNVSPLDTRSAFNSVALLAPAAHTQDEAQQPVQQQIAKALTGQGLTSDDVNNSAAFDQAPACPFPPTKENSAPDKAGRLWSLNNSNNKLCAFRPYPDITPSAPVISWATASDCAGAANVTNSVTDDNGRLWGWQQDASCAFRSSAPLNGPVPPNIQAKSGRTDSQAFQELMSNLSGGYVSVVWEAAPACPFA
ncbi:hypothetical protein OEZ86_010086 [Tetradesmus obliquus]|uniref:Uncharacterized protein n=1 Tax=Tetradesmus obliquus TaxID=3088 RepID=A0ABY8US71_TETOB|nr:hypothetical protein OEZ85_001521 [Tetradesmus obliquus]WIA43646.1 hypothetical protein OEZ86_010086 [Tetradesmus obliquus]